MYNGGNSIIKLKILCVVKRARHLPLSVVLFFLRHETRYALSSVRTDCKHKLICFACASFVFVRRTATIIYASHSGLSAADDAVIDLQLGSPPHEQ